MPDTLQHTHTWNDQPWISAVSLPGGGVYRIKDAAAREAIAALEGSTAFLGVTSTELTDQCTTNPIMIDGESVTAKNGNIAIYGNKEFIFNGTKWIEFGDLSALGHLAYQDTVSLNKGTGINVLQGITAKVGAHQATTSGGTTGNALGTNATFTMTQPDITVNPSTTNIQAVATNGSVTVSKRESVISSLGTPSTDTFVKSVSAESNKKLVVTTLQQVSGVKSVLQGVVPTTQKLSTTTITAVQGTTEMVQSVTETKKALSLQAVTTIGTNSDVSIPNVTGNTEVTIQQINSLGSASTWTFTMGSGTNDEMLIISGANSTIPSYGANKTATNTVLGTSLSASKITNYDTNLANGNVENTTSSTEGRAILSAINTTKTAVAVAANEQTTVATGSVGSTGGADIMTGVTDNKVDVAAAGGNVTVATGSTAADGTGDSIVTGITIGTSATAITSITPETVSVLQGVSYTDPTVTISASGDTSGYSVVTGISSATAANGAVTVNNADTVQAVTNVGTINIAEQTVNVTENKEKVAKYDDLSVTVS